MPKFISNCFGCKSLQGIKRISPSAPVWQGKYWTLEHKGNSPLYGWVILVLNTHKESLQELTAAEWQEYGIILPRIIAILKELLVSQKQYVFMFSEKENYQHLHWHIVPIVEDVPPKFRGPKIYDLAKIKDCFLSEDQIIFFADKLRKRLN